MDNEVDDRSNEASAEPAVVCFWTIESKITMADMVKRLHKSTCKVDPYTLYPKVVVTMLAAMSAQAGAPVMFAVAMLAPCVGLAAGPCVRVSAWHQGSSEIPPGWLEMRNFVSFLSSRSGGGKSNLLRLIKKAIKIFEEITGKGVLTTSYTVEVLLNQMDLVKSVFIGLDEGGRFDNQLNQFKGGKGDDKEQMMELIDGESIVKHRVGSGQSSQPGHSNSKKKKKKGGHDESEGESDCSDGDDDEAGGDDDEGSLRMTKEKKAKQSKKSSEDSNVKTITSHLNVLACTHDHAVLQARLKHVTQTDGDSARRDVMFVPSKSARQPGRDVLRKAVSHRL